MKKFLKKYWWLVLILAVFLFIVIKNAIKSARLRNKKEVIKEVQVISYAGSQTPVENMDRNKVLSKGSSGPEVKYLQMIINVVLKAMGKQTIAEDGIFGDQTETALIEISQGTMSQTSINNAIAKLDALTPGFSISSFFGL